MVSPQARRTAMPPPSSTSRVAAALHDRQQGGSSRLKRPMDAAITLYPLIGDILRTRYCTPGSVFLIEDIQTAALPGSVRWHAVQLLLGDGRLCIQALLDTKMHSLIRKGEITVGCYVQLDKFSMGMERIDAVQEGQDSIGAEHEEANEEANEEASEDKKKPRHMVYLVVDEMIALGRNETYLHRWSSKVRSQEPGRQSAVTSTDRKGALRVKATHNPSVAANAREKRSRRPVKDTSAEEAFENFDTLTYPLKISPRKPKKLPEPPQTIIEPEAQETPTTTATLRQATPSSPSKKTPVSLPRDWHNPRSPLKLTPLHSISHLPYAQGWSCNILAIVVSLSPVEPSFLPPHRQRIARLSDPSTSKLVHLTVFLDPEHFEPTIGKAVLLVGVKNHPFDGGSLKKYASDGATGPPAKEGVLATGRTWWYEDPWDMGWCDVAGIKEWWAQTGRATFPSLK